jgi:TolA-binding protein
MRDSVRPTVQLIIVLMALACRATAAHATEPDAVSDSVRATPNPPAAAAPAAPAAPSTPAVAARIRARSPLAAELDAVLAAERALLRRLEVEVRRVGSSEAGLALQRQIAQVKQNTEIELLRVQARHARREGRTELAEQLEASVRELLMTPEERAAAERARHQAPAPPAQER